MLKRTRVTGSMDMSRLGSAVSGPGIDTREWAMLGVVTGFGVMDDDVLAGVHLLATGQDVMARVGACYAGNGFGIYAPLEIDDEVLVVMPEGVTDAGPIVVARLWSKADPPPDRAQLDQHDLLIRVKDGKTLRIDVGGSGQVIIAGGTNGAARLGDAVVVTMPFTPIPLPGPPIPFSINGTITAGSSKVKIG